MRQVEDDGPGAVRNLNLNRGDLGPVSLSPDEE
jgi:hypothetical protein